MKRNVDGRVSNLGPSNRSPTGRNCPLSNNAVAQGFTCQTKSCQTQLLCNQYPMHAFILFFIDYFDIGGGISGHTIFHPESVIPRTVKLRLNAQILGLAVDVLEVDARMEGLEVYMEKIVGDNGYFSKEFVKQLFSIPENMKSSENSRKRRNPEGDSLWKSINILHNMVGIPFSCFMLHHPIKVYWLSLESLNCSLITEIFLQRSLILREYLKWCHIFGKRFFLS